MSTGFRIYTKRRLPPLDLVEALGAIPPANIADCMNRLSAMNQEIRRMTAPSASNMFGVAMTVKVRPGDNLMIHKALDMAGPGDILVVANSGDRSQSLMGEIMVAHAKSRGVAGIVLDAPVRDVDALYTMGIPVYATGSTPGGPYKEGPGEINVAITCGNIAVMPGDILVGDSDGVVVIPQKDAANLLEAAKKFSAIDQSKAAEAMAGKLDRAWVDTSLAAKGCEVIEDIFA